MRPHWYRFMLLFLVTALCCLQTAVAANGKIRGVIKSADGEAVVSANVLIEGTTMGAAADANGQYFILNVPPGSVQIACRLSSLPHQRRLWRASSGTFESTATP